MKIKYLPLREWLELGQVMNDKSPVLYYKYFRKHDTYEIHIGKNLKVKADGKIYKSGIYKLKESFDDDRA